MSTPGIKATNLGLTSLADSVLVVRGGSARQIEPGRLSAQLGAVNGPTYETRTQLYADLAWAAGSIGKVVGDTTLAYRGIYKKTGASGAGSWGARIGPLPEADTEGLASKTEDVNRRASVHLSTASRVGDAIVSTLPTSVTVVTGAATFTFTAQHTNVGPVTIDIGGLDTFTVVNADGSALAPGDWRNGRVYSLKTYVAGELKQLRILGGAVQQSDLVPLSNRAPARFAVVSRTLNDYVANVVPAATALEGNTSYWITSQHTNTGPVTIDIGGGPIPVVNADGTPLAAGDWRSLRHYLLKAWIVGEVTQLRMVGGAVQPSEVTAAATTASDAQRLAEQIGVDQLVRQRGWPVRPELGMYAMPDAPSAAFSYGRTGAATRLNERGVLVAVPAGQPIHDHDDAGVYLGWRFDPPKTLASLHTVDFTQAYWARTRCTVTPAAAIGRNLRGLADRVLETVENGTHGVGRLTGNASLVAGQKYWMEAYVKPFGRRYIAMVVDGIDFNGRAIGVDLETGQVYGTPHSDFVKIGTRLITTGPYAGFVHMFATIAAPSDVASVRYYLGGRDGAGVASYVGDPTKGYDISGFAWGVGDYVHGWLESTDAVAVRARPDMWAPKQVSMREGTIVLKGRIDHLPATPVITRALTLFGGTPDYISLSITTTGRMYGTYATAAGGVTIPAAPPAELAIELGKEFVAAISWRAGRQLFSINGRVYQPDAHSPNAIDLPGELVLSKQFRTALTVTAQMIKEAFYMPRALGEDELSAVTAPQSGLIAEPAYAVDAAWPEVASDPSEDMLLSWIAGAASPAAAEYRVVGATSWMSAGAVKRAFPETAKSVFTAHIAPLTPETLYEWRPAGSGADKVRRFRTAPDFLSRPLRLVAVSDWQRTSANALDPASDFNVLNGLAGAYQPDVALFAGDYADDNGGTSSAVSQRWIDFMRAWSTRMSDADGAVPPVAAIAGNHEAGDGSPGGGAWDGAGAYGYMDKVFSTFYRPRAGNVGGQGYGWFTVGEELLCVGLETNHATPIAEQVPWLEALLAEKAADYRHVIVYGHFGPAAYYNDHWQYPGHKTMREQVAPIVQQYPNARFMICGHNHVLMATRKVLFSEMPAGGVNAWHEDPDGIRIIGAGGWGSPANLDYNAQNQAADAVLGDGSVLVEYLVATNQVPRNVAPISAPNNTSGDPATRHIWTIDLSESQQTAKAISLNGTVLVDLTEGVA